MTALLETRCSRFLARALACVFLLPVPALAQVINDWSATNAGTYGDMVALDNANNAYVVGSVPWSTILVAKYSPAGALLWRRDFDNPGSREQGSWVTVDPAGNAIVVGRLVAGAGNDPSGIVVLKYDPAGNLLWQDVIPGAFSYAARVVTDRLGNAYVLGRAWSANASGNTTHDIVTIKYSPAGVREWTRNLGFDSTSADSPSSMVVTPAGNVIVTGGAVGSMLMAAYDPAGNALWSKAVPASTAAIDVAVAGTGDFYVVGGTYSSTTGNAALVIKHDASFNEIWRRTYSAALYGLRVAVDSLGNPIVTGISSVNGGYFNWSTFKLDPNGNTLWTRAYNLHRSNDEIPYGIVTGPDNAIYITGQGGPGPVPGEFPLGEVSYLRAVTVKYAADGAHVWAMTTFDTVRGLGLKLGSDNALVVIGQSPLRLMHYQQDGVISIAPKPIATADKTSGPAPLSVAFTAQVIDGFGITGYNWDFGDGSSSLDMNPAHVYAAGTYAATLSVIGTGGGVWTSAPLTITATAVAPPPPVPTSLALASSTVVGGRSTQGTVTLSGTAGAVVQLASSNTSLANVPASVQIPAGASSASFKITTSRVRAATAVTISASANGTSVAATLALTR